MRHIFFILLALLSAPVFADNSVQNENTRASLISAYDAAKPGSDITVGVLLQPTPGWHTYWENPGDAGIATTLEWTLPEGVKAGGIKWPTPTRIAEDTLVVHGYKGDVLLPVTLHVPENYTDSSLPLKVKAEWLVCKNICVPESAELSLDIAVGNEPVETPEYAMFKSAAGALPGKIDTPLTYTVSQEAFEISLPDYLRDDNSITFFPREQNQIIYAHSQRLEGNILKITRNPDEEAASALTGYLVVGSKAYDVRAEKTGAAASKTQAPSGVYFFNLLLFAVLGGLILNLMPCVLPVLSLKAIAIAKKSGHDRHIVVKQALAYTVGVLTSFAVIASLLIALQIAGAAIGWGFQMQSPPFVGFLALLLFLVALNLAGMFEVPVLFGDVLSDTREHGLRGSFATGVLATMVATPCTAPFMATAVGATLTLPPLYSLAIFLAVGLGLALPFLIIAIFPKLVSYLPKPGAWMVSFRQLMAFPMFASVIWLVWVLAQQVGAHGLLVLMVTMLAISFIIWLKEKCHDRSSYCKIAILLVLLAALANGLSAIAALPMVAPPASEESFSEEKLQTLRDEGKPVFVDATAAWCLTCQLNAKTAINTPAAQAAFRETGTTLLIADWTNRDASITAFLKKFGYNGVPLYVYFPPYGEPVVLPQLLTEALVVETLTLNQRQNHDER